MCGRLALAETTSTIKHRYNAGSLTTHEWSSEERKDDITPGRDIPVISKVIGGPGISLTFDLWGWWFMRTNDKGKRVKQAVINSRHDTILANLDNPRKVYLEGLTNRRAIIPANAFFEWPDGVRTKFSHPTEKIMSLAGFIVMMKTDKGWIDTVTIITTEPTKQIADIGHDRMPLILNGDQEREWLECKTSGRQYLEGLFKNNRQEFLIG